MNKAQNLLNQIGTNPWPDQLARVAELTDQMPINREGIESDIEMLQRILQRWSKNRDSHIQGMANVGIVKLGLG